MFVMRKKHLYVFLVALALGIFLLVPDTRTTHASVVGQYSHAMKFPRHTISIKKKLGQQDVCVIIRMKNGRWIWGPGNFLGWPGGIFNNVPGWEYGIYGNCGGTFWDWSPLKR